MSTLIESGLLPWQVSAMRFILRDKVDVLLLTGGFGSGKTAVNAHIIRKLCFDESRVGLVIGNTFSSLRDTVGITLEDELGDIFIEDRRRVSPLAWTLKSKAGVSKLISRTMRFGHEASPRLKSINADFLWLIEATELPKEAFTIGISRLRKSGKDGYYPAIIETNPSSKSNWVYKTFIEDSIEIEKYEHWSVNEKIVEYRVGNELIRLRTIIINTTTQANPHFSNTTLAQMLSKYSPGEIQRLIYGQWNVIDGRVWDSYIVYEHPLDLKRHAQLYDNVFIGIDPAQETPTGVAFIGMRGNVYEVFDEIYEKQRSVREIYAKILQIMETWGLQGRPFNIWIDPSASGWIREFREIPNQIYGVFKSTHKGTEPDTNRAVRLGELLRTKRLIISSLCKAVIADIEQTSWKTGVKDKIDKEKYDPHAMDAVGYACIKEI